MELLALEVSSRSTWETLANELKELPFLSGEDTASLEGFLEGELSSERVRRVYQNHIAQAQEAGLSIPN